MAMSAPNAPGPPDAHETALTAYDWSIRIESPGGRNGALGRHGDRTVAEKALKAALGKLPIGTTATGTLRRSHVHGWYPSKPIAVVHRDADGSLVWSPL